MIRRGSDEDALRTTKAHDAGPRAGTASPWTLLGFSLAGTIAGASLGIAGATVASTHFCVGSFGYRQVERAVGKSSQWSWSTVH